MEKMHINIEPEKDDEEEYVQCPACKGGKKCQVAGFKVFSCPLCDGEGEIALNELLEYIVEQLCILTARMEE